MKQEKLVPELRFKEFDGNWILNKLNEWGETVNGLTYSPNDISDEGIIVLRSSNIKNGQLSFADIVKVNTSKYNPVQKNDILICVRNGSTRLIGKNVIIPAEQEGLAFGAFMSVFRSDINNFVQYLFATSRYKKLIQADLGARINSINNNNLKKYKFFFPSLPEQQKIADFLTSVDHKIQALTRKVELLKDYKKGVMQKVFKYNHIDKSNLRFGSLSDFGYFYYGKGAPKTTIKPGADTPCVRYGELYSTYNEEIKEIRSYTTVDPTHLKLSVGGEVLVPRVGEKPLEFANCSYLKFPKVAIGEMISVYNTKENGLFMTYYINSQLKKDLARLVEGGNVSNLYYRYVEQIRVAIPNIQEQTKIANFLTSIDHKICAVESKLQKMQEWKKGLLQKMFV